VQLDDLNSIYNIFYIRRMDKVVKGLMSFDYEVFGKVQGIK
jgi:hypothetical protein